MRILFDQGVPVPLREHLRGHEVRTAFELGWSQLANGDLLAQAEASQSSCYRRRAGRAYWRLQLESRRRSIHWRRGITVKCRFELRHARRNPPWMTLLHSPFTAVIERDGKWFVAYCPEVPGANGQGRTKAKAKKNLADAIALILEDRR